ncbi:MAG: hypothetical protein AAFX87_20305 [Bacteroidota bacterium]
MKKDINIPSVKNVTLAVVKKLTEQGEEQWNVYIINKNDFAIENTLVASKGYGEKDGEKQQTSTLRHFLETVDGNTSVLIEPIDPALFHLNNEYWVSYYVNKELFDKRFIFVPDAIKEENLTYIEELEMDGVLHS